MTMNVKDWVAAVIKQDEIDKYLIGGKDFIDEGKIYDDMTVLTIRAWET